MNVLLLVEGLAQAADREAGGFRGVDDDLFAPRQQVGGGWDFLDGLGRDDDGAVPIGMNDVVRRDCHTGDADRAAVIDEMHIGMRRHDRTGEHQEFRRHRVEVATDPSVITPAQPSPLWMWV